MAETNHDGCEQECGGWEEGFADARAGMQEWSITVHDGICRCEFCVTGIAPIEAALGDMAGILREIRGELKPAEPSDELTVPGPAGGDPRPPAVFINSGAGVGHQAGKEPLAGERSRRSNFRGTGNQVSGTPGGFPTDSPRIHPVCLIAPLHQHRQELQNACPPNCPVVVADGGVFQQA